MRVFAGPNGSGKSSIIKSILNTKVGKNKTLDFGIYINADDIAVMLKSNGVDFASYKVEVSIDSLIYIAKNSGLINNAFKLGRFKRCIVLKNNTLHIDPKVALEKNDNPYERIAQILADYLRKVLLEKGEKFSFETVFSHKSKVEIIKKAQNRGYKVYFYFVLTEAPEINIFRVKVVRVGQKGHDVDKKKIVDRYYRSMELMYEAVQYTYQAYFFDNSTNGDRHTMFAHFKMNKDGEKQWDKIDNSIVPVWFRKYYSEKIDNNKTS